MLCVLSEALGFCILNPIQILNNILQGHTRVSRATDIFVVFCEG